MNRDIVKIIKLTGVVFTTPVNRTILVIGKLLRKISESEIILDIIIKFIVL